MLWKDVKEVKISTGLFADMASWATLKDKQGNSKHDLLINIASLKIDLLLDILNYVPSGTNVKIHPYFRKRLEKKIAEPIRKKWGQKLRIEET